MAFPLSAAEHVAIKGRIARQTELVVGAAVRFDGAIITFERPGRHGDCLNWLHHHGIARGNARDHGFITNHGRFVDRAEAARIVLAAGQGSPRMDQPVRHLFSEDMWNDHDQEPIAAIKPEEVF